MMEAGYICQLRFFPKFQKNRESAIDLSEKKAYNNKKI